MSDANARVLVAEYLRDNNPRTHTDDAWRQRRLLIAADLMVWLAERQLDVCRH